MSYLTAITRKNLLSLQKFYKNRLYFDSKFKSTSAAKATSSSSSASSRIVESNQTNETNAPLQFFGSNAATWKARQGFSGGADQVVWYQPYVITGSLTIFLLYFCVFREESDIDRKLEGNLFDHVEGLEETQLNVIHKYNLEHGLPVADIERRMAEVQAEKYQNQVAANK